MPREFFLRPNADEVIASECADQVGAAADELARQIPANVPVREGVAQRLYTSALKVERQDDGSAIVTGFPFLWHWLEYGTRFNAAYRPIENTARGLGFNWSAQG
jgi:hypothetical protein